MNKRDAYTSGMANGSAQRDDREVRGAWSSFQRHWYADPGPDLAPFVSRYWFAAWDLHGQSPYRQLIVPYPNMHLSFVNDTAAAVHGVARGHLFRVLEGDGRVFGVAIRPGRFRPFLRSPVSAITDRSVAAIVARIAAEPDITRVDTLADRLGTSVRRLQRLFAEYVGVGPKWVIRIYRLHEVNRRLHRRGRRATHAVCGAVPNPAQTFESERAVRHRPRGRDRQVVRISPLGRGILLCRGQ